MKKVYSFTQSMMNGTVTIGTSVALFATRELAEQTLADIKTDNAKRDLGGLSVGYSKIQEIDMYETKDEIPFYQFKGEGDMKQKPIPMPTNNPVIWSKKKQLYAISPEELKVIKRLRSETGAGLHDCKTALRNANGDYDKAMKDLRYRPLDVLTNVIKED